MLLFMVAFVDSMNTGNNDDFYHFNCILYVLRDPKNSSKVNKYEQVLKMFFVKWVG